MALPAHTAHGSPTLDLVSVTAAVGLGAFHGVNPAMGWLFAVSYGLQERSERAILRSLAWIVVGHEASVLPIALVVTVFASQVSRGVALGLVAVVLVTFGLYLLLRRRHFRWVGMRLRPWQLAWWSFLMSTAMGAGLMLAPVLLHTGGVGTGIEEHLGQRLWVTLLATLAHAAGMALAAGVLALLVHRVLGLRVLRTHWVNLDRVWAFAFVVGGLGVMAAWWLG